MHRGVRVDGATVHNLRSSKGWSQRQLAKAAGISERTVRNAEKSSILESYIANYLAIALDVPLNEIVEQRAAASRGNKLKNLTRRFASSYSKAVVLGSVEPLLELLHPKIQWSCQAAPNQQFTGQFQGVSQVRSHLQGAGVWWEQFSAKPTDFVISRSDAEGDMLYFQLTGGFRRESGEQLDVWQTFIARLDDDLVSLIDQYVGLSVVIHAKNTRQSTSFQRQT
ncbi:MAG: helix-turn-helix domain-containing protein [Pirellulales bacterium]